MLRLGLSPLRAHKARHNFEDVDSRCIVCRAVEDNDHYLLHCVSFRLSRTALMQNISTLLNLNILTLPDEVITTTILYGDARLDFDTNTKIILEVTAFIATSKRLDTL